MADEEPTVHETEGAKSRLLRKIGNLDDLSCQVLETMVDSLGEEYREEIATDTDIAIPAFAINFRQRLKIHHATHEEAFKKKTFEFAFKASSIAAGKTAEMDSNDSSPGYDVIVNGEKFSLKTEAGRSISPTHLTISKLMEARWIRDCDTGEDFQRGMAHLMRHFTKYDRVIMLRAIKVSTPFDGMRYQLLEIPMDVLRAVGQLQPSDFREKGATSGGSSAKVMINGRQAFRLTLDGSVEKITVSRLDVSMCRTHANWIVKTLLNDRAEEDE